MSKHEKVAQDCWKLIRALASPEFVQDGHDADLEEPATALIEMACDSAAEASAQQEERAGDLHRELNRRTAEALGKPFAGENSGWQDIPEQVAALVQRAAELEVEVAMLRDEYRLDYAGAKPNRFATRVHACAVCDRACACARGQAYLDAHPTNYQRSQVNGLSGELVVPEGECDCQHLEPLTP